MTRFHSLALCTCVLALVACDQKDDSGDGDGGGDDGTMMSACEGEDRAQEFVAGMEESGDAGMIKVSLVDASPAPPVRGDNVWTMILMDADGEPVDDAEIKVKPWMPDHGHGSPVGTMVEVGDQAGEYVLEPVNLHMRGYWEITISATLPADAGQDAVVFKMCVE